MRLPLRSLVQGFAVVSAARVRATLSGASEYRPSSMGRNEPPVSEKKALANWQTVGVQNHPNEYTLGGRVQYTKIKRKLTEEQVKEMRRLWKDTAHSLVSLVSLARRFGVSRATSTKICHGESWKHLL